MTDQAGPEGQIQMTEKINKNDHKTKKAKKTSDQKCCFEPNIQTG